MEQLKHFAKSLDLNRITLNTTQFALLGVSMASIEAWLRVIALIVSIIVGYVNIKDIKEKRKLRESKEKEIED